MGRKRWMLGPCSMALLSLMLLSLFTIARLAGPFPRRGARRSERPDLDFISDQVAPATVQRYEKALSGLNVWMAEKTGGPWQFFLGSDVRTFWELSAMYLTKGYQDRTLGLSHVANFLCGIRRRLLGVAKGEVDGETLNGLAVLWRMIGRRKQVDQHEFRMPVPLGVLKAVGGVLRSGGHIAAARCVALGIFCVTR